MGLSQPAITRSMAGLAGQGLIETAIAARDRRQRVMRLTHLGVETFGRARAAIWPRMDAAIAGLCEGLQGSLLELSLIHI